MTASCYARTFGSFVLAQIGVLFLYWCVTYSGDVITYESISSAINITCLDKWRELPVAAAVVRGTAESRKSGNVTTAYQIPNVVHYVWFNYDKSPRPFAFHHFLAVLSAHKRLRPDVIYFHCDREPGGPHWDAVKSLPSVKVVHRDPPRTIFGERIKAPAYETSDSNVARVMVVIEYGGIYLDTDVIVVRSLDPLRHHQCVLGLEDSYKVCAGVIMGAKDAAFLYLWINYFIDDYKVGTWAHNSGIVPSKLKKRYPDLVHVEKNTMHVPNWTPKQVVKIWGTETFDWTDNYTVHLWFRKNGLKQARWPNINNIKSWPGGFGELARYTLYDEVPERLKQNFNRTKS